MNDEFREGGIVFIKHMRFPDDNSIDYRMNGRPYLIYKVENNTVYLFKIGRSRVEEFSYYPIKVSNKGKEVECFVDLRYMILIDEEELENKMQAFHDDKPSYRNSKKIKYLSKKDFEKIKEKVEIISSMKELEVIASNIELIFNK